MSDETTKTTEGSRVVHVSTEEEFAKALAAAPGAVVVDFMAEDCDACLEDKPELEKLAAGCSDATIIAVDVDKATELSARFDVSGTPTMLYAKDAASMTPEKAKEVEPGESLRRRLKCAVK